MVKEKLQNLIHKNYFKLITICTFVLVTVLIMVFTTTYASGGEIIVNTNTSLLTLDSNLYTGVDDLAINTNKGALYTDDKLIVTSQDGTKELYFNEKLCIFKVKNTVTGYIYSSAYDKLNETASSAFYGGFLSSSFSIEYFVNTKDEGEDPDYDANLKKAFTTKAIKLKDSEKASLPEEEKDNFGLSIAPNTEYTYTPITNGMKVSITFANATDNRTARTYSIGIKIVAYVTLDNDGMHVSVPEEEIEETNSKYLLGNIIIMPALGSTLNNEVPGYMVVPDGSGALLRYGDIPLDEASQVTLNYYGDNKGARMQDLTSASQTFLNDKKTMSAPIFGYVNGINQDSVYGIMESGAYLSQLIISPCGAFNMKASMLIPVFRSRYVYYLYGVNKTMLEERNNEDIKMTYHFLSNEEANYVGIANDYQNYLVDNGTLVKKTNCTYKVQVDFLMSESTTSLFGYKTQTMTSLKSAKSIVNELKDGGMNELTIVLKGWNKLGYSGATPYSIKYNTDVGSKSQFKKWIDELSNDGNNVYLYNDYVKAYQRGEASSTSDAAKSNLKLRLSFKDPGAVLFDTYYYLYPQATLELGAKNIKKYSKLGATGLALDSIGNTLFTYEKKDVNYSRYDAYVIYDELLNKFSSEYNIGLYNPNEYMWKYTDDYFEMDTFTSALTMYSDSVPLIPYILKGYVDYYGDYLNFNAMGIDQYLRYLDYGAFPSYLLTDEISYKLKYTNSVSYYTTCYDDWKGTILSMNEMFEEGYKATLDSTVVKRVIPELGVSIVCYKSLSTGNYTTLIINYTSSDVTYMGQTVAPKSYKVQGGLYE